MQTQTVASAQPSPVPASCRIHVVPQADHRCVQAADAIAAGEVILTFGGRRVRRPDQYSVQIGPRTHIAAPEEIPWNERVAEYGWRYLNHSCEPNAFIRGVELVAREDIPAGVEITFDYNTTEWDMSHPFTCLCGSPSCVGTVRGYRHLDTAGRMRLLPYLAAHLRLSV